MISTSFFELFKIGPGPSSSHTVGPMFAANTFRKEVLAFLASQETGEWQIHVDLYGSLADTGKGHGTDRAVLAGLFGYTPIDVDVEKLNSYFAAKGDAYRIPFGDAELPFNETDITFHFGTNPYRHPNALSFTLKQGNRAAIESIFYSVGGGFVEEEGVTVEADSADSPPMYPYRNMAEFTAMAGESDATLIEMLYANEQVLTGSSKAQIDEKFRHIIRTMLDCVERGLSAEGILPGGLHVNRRAKQMFENAASMNPVNNHFAKMNAYALAVSEENAAGHIVVTAPTNGAAGILPAAVAFLSRDANISEEKLIEGLMVAGLIGFIIKENASISGAELGCMAEVGSATSMAAAMFSHIFGGDLAQLSVAAEIALEHSLGMTCDPINGLVQVPCIERNATGVIKAYNAYVLAAGRTTDPIITLDRVIEVMKQTGTDLSEKYRETSTGGLAVYGWGNSPGS